jgi:hypothetical protein
MSYLYKRSNRLWHLLIKHRFTAIAWRPIVEWTRLRHLKFRKRLERHSPVSAPARRDLRALTVIAAGV